MFLLDTNILSDLRRNPHGAVRRKMGEMGPENLAMSVITAGELLAGAAKKSSPPLTAVIEGLIGRIAVLDINLRVAREYAALRASLDRAGKPIGANDFWIAAHALAENLTLVTANEREFARVPGLKVENWLAA
jgi:tRNA(fMet)-specific endonuclease VapC